MKVIRYMTLGVLLSAGGLQCQEKSFNPDQQRAIIERSGPYAARLRMEGQGRRLTISEGTKTVGSLFLTRDVIAQVDAIAFAPNGKVVLLGVASGSINSIVILSLNPVEIIDRLYCFTPTLSPDRRFIAYSKFFPPHFYENVSYVYLLYDLQKSPADNRPSNIPLSDIYDVGKVIYPAVSKNQSQDNWNRPKSEIHMLASGRLFWSPKDDLLAFADLYQGKVSIVLASLSNSGSLIRIKREEIRKADVCLAPAIEECTVGVSSIQFLGGEHLSVKLRPWPSVAVPVKAEIYLDMSGIPVSTTQHSEDSQLNLSAQDGEGHW